MVLRFYPPKKTITETILSLVKSGLKRAPKYKNRQGRLYMSSDTICERKGFLSANFIGYKQDSAEMRFFVEGGNTSESLVHEGLEREGRLHWVDTREDRCLAPIPINVGGQVDGIITLREKLWVMEVKQIGTLPKTPKKIHVFQAQAYSAITGLPPILFYLDRKVAGRTQELMAIEFELEDSYEAKYNALYRLAVADISRKNGIIPAKPDYMKKSYCTNCDWFEKCWGEDSSFEIWIDQGFKHGSYEDALAIEQEAHDLATELLSDELVFERREFMMSKVFGGKNDR